MGIGDQNDVTIVVELDADAAIRAADRLDDTFRDLERTVEQSGDGFSNFQAGLVTLSSAVDLARQGFDLISGAFQSTFDQLDRAREIDGVANSFQRLQGSAALAQQTLNELRTATQGLVSDFELQKAANQAVLLGLPTEGFDKLAAAAIRLGSATGRDAVGAINDLVEGVGKGSTELLDNLGVVVRADDAYRNYAETLGKTASQLDDTEKKLAFQAEALRKITEGAERVAEVQDDASSASQQLATAFSNLRDRVAQAVAENTNLATGLDDLAGAINSVDAEGLASDIASLIGVFSSAAAAATEFADRLRVGLRAEALQGFVTRLGLVSPAAQEAAERIQGIVVAAKPTETGLKAAGVALKDLNKALNETSTRANTTQNDYDALVNALRRYKAAVVDARKPTADLTASLERINKIEVDLGGAKTASAIKRISDELKIAKREVALFQDEAKKKEAEQALARLDVQLAKTSEKVKTATESAKKFAEAQKEAAEESKEFSEALERIDFEQTGLVEFERQVANLIEQNPGKTFTELETAVRDLRNEFRDRGDLVTYDDTLKAINKTVEEAAEKQEELEKAQKRTSDSISKSLDKVNADFDDLATSLRTLSELLNQIGDQEAQVFEGFTGISASDASGIFGTVAGVAAAFEEARKVFSETGTRAIIQSSEDIGDAIEKSSKKNEKRGAAAGKAVGAAIGGALTLGLGGQVVGAAIGEKIGELIGGLLGDPDPGGVARDFIDQFFEDAFDAARLILIIEDEFLEIDTLLEERFVGFFETLNTATEEGLAQFEGFKGISQAFTEIFEATGIIGGEQIGAVLANTFENLNNVQLALQGIGITAEEATAALEEAFLVGDVAAGEFLSGIRGIENVFKQGIPDGIGLIEKAFENLVEGGNVAGRLAKDALGDLAAEAEEASDRGISSLEDLKNELIASGQDADKVAALFDAIAKAGITSLDQLKDISTAATAAIIADLEAQGDFFLNTAEQVKDLKEQIDSIRDKEVDLTFNIRTNIDSGTREALDEGLFNESGTEIPQSEGTSQETVTF